MGGLSSYRAKYGSLGVSGKTGISRLTCKVVCCKNPVPVGLQAEGPVWLHAQRAVVCRLLAPYQVRPPAITLAYHTVKVAHHTVVLMQPGSTA